MISEQQHLDKIRNLHSVETPRACKRIGGSWEEGACILNEWGNPYFDVGFTAPIKGGYFWYEINCMDESGFRSDVCRGNVVGCLVKSDMDDDVMYPHQPGWCFAFYDKRIQPQDFVGDVTRNHMLEVYRDVARGRAAKHGLAYFTRDGKKLSRPMLHSFVGDKDGDIFKDIKKHFKPFRFKRGRNV